MNKQEFLDALRERLAALPDGEAEKSVSYYEEMIEDRMEDGMPEEEAVAALGSIDRIVEHVQYDQTLPALMMAKMNESKEKAKNKGLWLTLVLVGSPVWFPLLIAGAAVVFAVYVTVWSLIVSLYAVIFSLGLAAIAGVLGGIVLFFTRPPQVGLCLLGAGLICGALGLFLFQPILLASKGLIRFTAHMLRSIKSLFLSRKEAA